MTLQPQQVWLAIESVDLRLGIDGLSLLPSAKPPVMAAPMLFVTNAATASSCYGGTAPAYGSVHADYIAAASSGRTQPSSFVR